MTISTLTLDEGSDDTQQRRSKRDKTPENGTVSTATGSNILTMPFMAFMLLIQMTLRLMMNFVSEPIKTVRETFFLTEEQNRILKEVPEEQTEQKETLHHVHEEQIHQQDKIDKLRRRIQGIEERMARRLAAAEQSKESETGGKDLKSE